MFDLLSVVECCVHIPIAVCVWVRKLTSRKLWTAVASFVSMMILATGGTDNTATQVTALIMAGASVVAYIIGEGLTDSANIGASDDAEEQ